MEFKSEDLAPEVDWDLLRGLIRREISKDLAADTYRLVYTFKSWHDAHAKLLMEELGGSATRDDADPSTDD